MGEKLINPEKLCMGCMETLLHPEMTCPKCGFVRGRYKQPANCIPLYEIVNGKYLIGKVIGIGGFGITYIGWDLYQNKRVCIKEYFPRGVAERDTEIFISVPYNTYSMSVFTQNTEQAKLTYIKGLNSYIREAETLSKFYMMPGIVSVRDFFYGNHTAYIVMEYIEGINLKQLAETYGGILEPGLLFHMLKDVMCALNAVHKEGIIHRDISPDNIMVNKEYQAKLIDFGAAGSYRGTGDAAILLKHGYAPVEQYNKNGKQGPWTDIYSLCATIYFLLTGVKMQKATDRVKNDEIRPLTMFGTAISKQQEFTIMKGLSIWPENRYQSMAELYYALFHEYMPTKPGNVFHRTLGDKKKCRLDVWAKGMVLDGRYLLGEIYQEKENQIIWYAFDNILGVSCFLLRGWDDRNSSQARRGSADFRDTAEEGYEILGYRSIGGHPVWVFSMENHNLSQEQCRIWDILSQKAPQEVSGVSFVKKGENGLPENTILVDRYRVLGILEMEGDCITYLCEDINMGRNVAIKEYFPAQWAQREDGYVSIASSKWLEAFQWGKKAFIREIGILAKFIHEKCIVTVYDGFSANDTFYIVTEYVQGKSLGRIMQERGQRPFSVTKWKKVMIAVLEGMNVLHQRGILHGGISPRNIICTQEGKIKLTDLGAAREWKNTDDTFAAVFLNPGYASPEQYCAAHRGQDGADGPWTDIYSLGATMYYCLTGRRPPSVMERLAEGKESVDFTLKDRFRILKKGRGFIKRCMELDRKKRPQSLEELMGI